MPLLGHERSKASARDDWITPRVIIEALGPFDLDPCASKNQPWETARRIIAPPENGLVMEWGGLVWMNPPYGKEIDKWTWRMASYGNGIMLTFARVETKWFWRDIWCKAEGIYFIKGRITFHRPDGSLGRWTSGGPSCLAAYGDEALKRLKSFSALTGILIENWSKPS